MRNEQEEKGKERKGLYDKLGEQRMDDVRRENDWKTGEERIRGEQG